jgi:LacI family transcriptional regulator
LAATINDIAKRAGVSIKTVSRVVNNEPHVRDALRDKVIAAMLEMDYSPNSAARRLASNRSFSIGLLFGGAPGEYFSQIIYSILASSAQQGYTVVVSNFEPGISASQLYIYELVKKKAIDGLILTPPCDNDKTFLDQLQTLAVPFVRLTPADLSSPLPYVTGEDQRGAYDMTEYLLSLGHQRIGFVSGPPNHHASQERFDGYLTALNGHNIRFEQAWVRQADFLFDKGIKAGKELLELTPRPTAIFASDDESAAGVLVAAHELGIRVPEELSIAGFDDFPIAQKVFPGLTTVSQPMEKISIRATQLLMDMINKCKPDALHIRIPTTLVVRNSTGACRS